MPRRFASVDATVGGSIVSGRWTTTTLSREVEMAFRMLSRLRSVAISDPSRLGAKAETDPFSATVKSALIGSFRERDRRSSRAFLTTTSLSENDDVDLIEYRAAVERKASQKKSDKGQYLGESASVWVWF